MAKLILFNLSSLANQASAISTMNANNDLIEAALENTLSRDGTAPNAMGSSLDMNSHNIFNLASPTAANHAATKDYVDTQVAAAGGGGGGGGGSGTVTSIALASSTSALTISGSPITSSGTITLNLIPFVGDTGTGGAKGVVPAPSAGDSVKYLRGDGVWAVPAGSGTVTSVGIAVTNPGITVSGGSPVTSAGTINLTVDPELAALASVTSAADKLFYFNGVNSGALIDFPSLARTLVSTSDPAIMRQTMGLAFGTNIREVLTGSRTYYVRTDGSDANTGLANNAAGAFLTITKAIQVVTGLLDFGGQTVIIQIGDGTYTTANSISAPWVGGGALIIQGNTGNRSSVVVSPSVGSPFSITCVLPGILTIRWMTISSGGGSCLSHLGAGTCRINNIRFGAATGGYQIYSGAPGAFIQCVQGGSDYTYFLAGTSISAIFATDTAKISFEGGNLQWDTGAIVYSNSNARAEWCGMISVDTVNFFLAGTVTGPRYACNANGVINTRGKGATAFPGSSSGTAVNGGYYA